MIRFRQNNGRRGAEPRRPFCNIAMKIRCCRFLRLACMFMLMTAGHGWGSVTPWEIEVKGIVTVLDDRRVFITTHDPAGGEKSYILAEEQSRDGIKLLSVDIKNNVAQFDNHGTLQVLRICSTPELTTVSAASQTTAASLTRPAAMGGTPAQTSTAANSSNETVEGFNSGFATVVASTASSKNTSTGSGNASASSGNASTDAATGANPANGSTTGASSTSGSSSSEINTWWYGGSQDIERARLETEDAVRQGVLPPYPLTPLTPPGTPTELIGPGQAFFNHFNPQYRVN
jgi:hypothetical protein